MGVKLAIVEVVVAFVAFFFWRRAANRISPAEARRRVADGALLLDVRTPGEFAGGHIDGAVNIPVQQLPQRSSELGEHSRPIVVYCQSGARSANAKDRLLAEGFTDVADLGGIGRWSAP